MSNPAKEEDESSRVKRSARGSYRRERTLSYDSSSDSTSPRDAVKRVLVDHTYIDHLADPKVDNPCGGDGRPKRGAPRGGVTVAFPEKLHEMLTKIDEEGLTNIVSWQPHGRCFLVHKKKEFIENIMPRFFHQSKLTSFQRQLNLYGFVRLTAGRDRGAYYHELFIRGRPDLSRRMVRRRVKGNGMKAASNPQNEPNFYAMVTCPTKVMDMDGRMDESPIAITGNSMMDTNNKEGQGGLLDVVMHEETTDDDEEEEEERSMESDVTSTSWIQPATAIPLVSPMCTPRQPARPLRQPVDISFLNLPDPMDDLGGDALVLSPSIVSAEETDPQTGDEVFFEGLKFRYLDHADCGLVSDSSPPSSSSTNTDYFSPFLDQIASSM